MEEIQTRYQNLMDKFQWDRTGMFDWILERYKEKEILAKGTKEVLESYKKLLEHRENDLEDEKQFINYLMNESGEKKVESKFWNIGYRKSPWKLVITGEVSEDYKEYKEVATIDKNKIKEDIKAGKQIDFANIEVEDILSIK